MDSSSPPKKIRKITEVWAWICTEADGGEGIPVIKLGDLLYPLIGADLERLEQLEPYALSVAEEHARPIKLVKFTTMELVCELTPLPPQ